MTSSSLAGPLASRQVSLLAGAVAASDAPSARAPSPLAIVRPAGPSVTMLRGREAILQCQPLLADLAQRTGQSGEADSIAYFLSTRDALCKVPHLLLMGASSSRQRTTPGLDSPPAAAVLVFEYRTPLGGTRVFATGDGSGRRDILAPAGQRARVAALAARTLVARGAHIVHLAFCDVHDDSDHLRNPRTGATPLGEARASDPHQAIASEFRGAHPPLPQAEWTLAQQDMPAYLPLFDSFDATLARMGQKTRANLRYYRRRAMVEHGCTFVASPRIAVEEFMAFNKQCTYAVPDEVAAFRFRATQTQPGHCMRGIRDGNGRWLSLVGLRRHHGFADIDWQMNRGDLPAWSLATVMRSCLIDHEIALGSTRLYIEGGTPQPIRNSFLRLRVGELTVRRDSHYVRLLGRFAPFVFPPKNYVGQILLHPDLQWRRW